MNAIQFNPDSWTMMKEQANMLLKTGFLPQSIRTPEHAIAIMMLGQELGVGAWAALTSINVIQNKPTVSPQLMLALINRSGQLEDMKIQDEGGTVHVMMKRKGRTEHWECFGQSDAEKMGLWNKDNWKKQPATMMKWRAVAACARVVFADVILGLYTPDEMGAETMTDEQGNMTVIEVKPTPPPQLVEKTVDTETGEITPPADPAPEVAPPAVVEPTSVAPDPLAWVDEARKQTVWKLDLLVDHYVPELIPSAEALTKLITKLESTKRIEDGHSTRQVIETINGELSVKSIQPPQNLGELKKLVIQDLKLVKGGEVHWTRLLNDMRERGELTQEMELNQDYPVMFAAIQAHYANKLKDAS